MSLGAICSVAILALMTATIFPSVSADDYKKWGDNVEGKGLDNRFIVGNWKRWDKERKHLSDPPKKIEGPLVKLRRQTDPPNVSMRSTGERGGRGGKKMAEERDPQQQKWGKLEGEGVDNHFWNGSLRRMDTNDDEPSNANLLEIILKQCGNSSGIFPIVAKIGCTVNQAEIFNRKLANSSKSSLICICKVTPNLEVLNEDCCNSACCKNFTEAANKTSSPILNSTDLMTQNISIIVQKNLILTESTTDMVSSSTTTTTEMISTSILHSTTASKSSSAPKRKHQDLALVATAILIYNYGRR